MARRKQESASDEETATSSSDLEEIVHKGELVEEGSDTKDSLIYFSGPLPPPKLLEQYQSIQPDFPERILRLNEQEVGHRHEIQRAVVNNDFAFKRIGQLFGFVIALAGFAASVGLAYIGYPWVAAIIGGGTLASVVTVFVSGPRASPEKSSNDSKEE